MAKSAPDSDSGAQPPMATDGKKTGKKKDKALSVRANQFKRGPDVALKHIKDKKLKGKLRQSEKLVKDAALSAAKVSHIVSSAHAHRQLCPPKEEDRCLCFQRQRETRWSNINGE
eukprot:380914-Prorocentrum_minimum.AAC.5